MPKATHSQSVSALSDFLLARITEREQEAMACAKVYPPPWDMYDRGWTACVTADEPNYRHVADLDQRDVAMGTVLWLGDALAHVAYHDPAQVLADCKAKRLIVNHCVATASEAKEFGQVTQLTDSLHVLKLLAQPHEDHRDFQHSWQLGTS